MNLLADKLMSKHGIVLQYTKEDGYLVNDGSALYVDNLIDCFETWNGTGSLKE